MSKESHFSFDNLGKEFPSSLQFIQYALVCPFLRPTYPQHSSVAPISAVSNRLSLYFFKVHHSATYVMTGHMSAFTNVILSYFRIPLSFQIVSSSMVAF